MKMEPRKSTVAWLKMKALVSVCMAGVRQMTTQTKQFPNKPMMPTIVCMMKTADASNAMTFGVYIHGLNTVKVSEGVLRQNFYLT